MIAPRILAVCLVQVRQDINLAFDLKLTDGEWMWMVDEFRKSKLHG